MRGIVHIAGFFAVFASGPASAQPPAAATPSPFALFFRPLIGTWPVRIVDRDPAGRVEYETVQLRDFRFALGGAFVRETAIVRDAAGRQVEAGYHLFGHDRARQRVLLHGFWASSADRFVFVDARIEGEGRAARLVGTMTVRHPDGREEQTRSEMGWSGPDQFVWRTFGTTADGRVYLNEELTYTIAAVEVLPAR